MNLDIQDKYKKKLDINKKFENEIDFLILHIINHFTEPPQWMLLNYKLNDNYFDICLKYLGYIPCIKKNKFEKITDFDLNDICVICQENLSDKVLKTSCKHLFHQECILNIENYLCPICRQEL